MLSGRGQFNHCLTIFAVGNLVGTLFHKEAAQRFKKEWLQSQKEQADEPKPQTENTGPRDMALRARTASRALQNLSTRQREQLLHKIAENLLAKEAEIMQENDKDCQVRSSSPTPLEDSEAHSILSHARQSRGLSGSFLALHCCSRLFAMEGNIMCPSVD